MAEDVVEISPRADISAIESKMGENSFYKEGTLDYLRREYDKRREEPTSRIEYVNFLLSFLRAAEDDAPPEKRADFVKMQTAAAEMGDYSHDGRHDENLKPVKEYFTIQKNEWEQKMEHSSGDEQLEARANRDIFASFVQTLDEPPLMRHETPVNDYVNPEMDALEQKHTQEQLPEFAFKFDETDTVLDNLQGKEATLEGITHFMEAAQKDFETQKHTFQTENSDLIAMAEEARTYWAKHPDIVKKGHLIAVTEQEGKITARLEKDAFDEQGNTMLFDPGNDVESPYHLGRYLHVIDRYDQFQPDDIAEGLKVLKELTGNKKTSMLNLIPVLRIIDLYHGELNNRLDKPHLSDEDLAKIEQQRNTLEEFAIVLKSKEKPQPVRHFFTKIKGKIRNRDGYAIAS